MKFMIYEEALFEVTTTTLLGAIRSARRYSHESVRSRVYVCDELGRFKFMLTPCRRCSKMIEAQPISYCQRCDQVHHTIEMLP